MKSDFEIWKKRNKKRLDIAEKERINTYEKTVQALECLSAQYSWDDIYLFGSLIKKGRFFKESDVDIGIKGLNKYDHYKFVADLSSFLERDVDVIRLEDCHFSKKIIGRGIRWNKKT
jgi:hypothetical protein